MAVTEEYLRMVYETKGAQHLDDLKRKIQDVEKEQALLKSHYDSLLISEEYFTKETMKNADALKQLNNEATQFNRIAQGAALNTGAASRAFLEFSRGVEDFTVAGPLGVLNNIPGIFQGIGQAVGLSSTAVAGLTAVVSLGGTAAYLLYRNWDSVVKVFDGGATERQTEHVAALKKETEEAAKAAEALDKKLRGATTKEEEEFTKFATEKLRTLIGDQGRIIEEAIKAAGGPGQKAAEAALEQERHRLEATWLPAGLVGTSVGKSLVEGKLGDFKKRIQDAADKDRQAIQRTFAEAVLGGKAEEITKLAGLTTGATRDLLLSATRENKARIDELNKEGELNEVLGKDRAHAQEAELARRKARDGAQKKTDEEYIAEIDREFHESDAGWKKHQKAVQHLNDENTKTIAAINKSIEEATHRVDRAQQQAQGQIRRGAGAGAGAGAGVEDIVPPTPEEEALALFAGLGIDMSGGRGRVPIERGGGVGKRRRVGRRPRLPGLPGEGMPGSVFDLIEKEGLGVGAGIPLLGPGERMGSQPFFEDFQRGANQALGRSLPGNPGGGAAHAAAGTTALATQVAQTAAHAVTTFSGRLAHVEDWAQNRGAAIMTLPGMTPYPRA